MNPQNIRRVDSKRTHGWQFVAVRDGEEYTKLFSDSVFGGKKKALAAAKEYRRRWLLQHGPIREITHHTTNKRNKIGIVGLSWIKENGKVVGVQTNVRIRKGVSKHKSFRFKGRSEEETIALAAEWRNAQLLLRESTT